jgi:hypothetical protein
VSESRPATSGPDLLNGWKDIATHLGKGVRTVQRWEKSYGLPIHRLGGGSAEIVFAYRHEVDAWLRSSERARAGNGAHGRDERGPDDEGSQTEVPAAELPPGDAALTGVAPRFLDELAPKPASPGALRWNRRLLLAAAAVALVVLAGLGWLLVLRDATRPMEAAEGQPKSWKVEDDTLRVFNAAGEQLWSHRFAGPVVEEWYTGPPQRGWSTPTAFEDLDNDGLREVLFVVRSSLRETATTLYCFNHDGSLRWARRLDDDVRFGDVGYAAPWVASEFRVLPNADATRSVWVVFNHGLLFPSVLEQIDEAGVVRSRYWSNGYIHSVSTAAWKGRPVLLVGAANNEHKGASLVILDREGATATAPAANPKYRCFTCPQAEPLGFVVIPPTPVGKIRGETTAPETAWLEGDGIVVEVKEPAQGADVQWPGLIYYRLDALLHPVDLEISRSYELLHNWWHEAGKLDRPYTPAEEARLTPLLKWEGGRFVEMEMVRR